MIIKWIILGVFIILGLFFLKMEHHTRKLKVAIIAILGFIIYFSLMGLLNSDDVDISSPRGIVNTIYSYFGWVGETGARLVDIGKDTVTLVGNAVKMNSTEADLQRTYP